MAEAICSDVLGFTNVRNYVSYEACRINGFSGCRSKNFLDAKSEAFVSLGSAFRFSYGADLSNKVYTYRNADDRIRFVIDFVYEFTGLDCTEYLCTILNFDMLVLNTDRHFYNMGFIKSDSGYRFAPIFDNGAALLSNMSVFPPDKSVEDNIDSAVSKPFCGSFERQALVLGSNLKIDYEGLVPYIETVSHFRVKEVLRLQVDRYKNYFPALNEISFPKTAKKP
ncbi:MAG: hypothetical protein LUG99_15380 [Lachnospiraceae bacterium]|nr:hypothetical protein [Lachnospiraceae bacterium]